MYKGRNHIRACLGKGKFFCLDWAMDIFSKPSGILPVLDIHMHERNYMWFSDVFRLQICIQDSTSCYRKFYRRVLLKAQHSFY
jgi:hypothetical protein